VTATAKFKQRNVADADAVLGSVKNCRVRDVHHGQAPKWVYADDNKWKFRPTNGDMIMARFHRLFAIQAIVLGAAFSTTAGFAFAGEANVSADQILSALKPKPLTRSLSVAPQADPAAKAHADDVLNSVRNRRTRSLSSSEREEIAEIAATKPNIDLEIQFDFNSAAISPTSMASVEALGKALSDPGLKGSTFVVAGHTDAVGNDAFNQDLSERRADAIKRYLVDHYGISGGDLVTVGYGESRLKDSDHPDAAVNRRVQVVNMETKTASK
jgi:outer membrane protein OmpA-like peptidoglycan-associated protein